MNLIPQRFHSLFNKNSPLPYIIILGLFFLAASCSTKSPDSPLKPYPDQTGKRENSRDWDFNYRKDRLYTKEQETAKGQDLESFSGPAQVGPDGLAEQRHIGRAMRVGGSAHSTVIIMG